MKIGDNPVVAPFVVNDFSGGMRVNVPPHKLNDNEYFGLINGRSRNGKITPVKLPVRISTNLPGTGVTYQGCYEFGTSILVFADGVAYIKNFAETNSAFSEIPGWVRMRRTVDYIYACGVPASSANFKRTYDSTVTGITGTDSFYEPTDITGSPIAIVCQDGYSRPLIIENPNTARVARSYSQWKWENPEYIPVGKQMLFNDSKLYIVSPDGRELYHSVTGRALDFVVAIDSGGNKVGDATVTSHSIGYEEITCLASLNIKSETSDYAPFFVGKNKSSHIVSPLSSMLQFGEPLHSNTDLFPIGPLNQFSFTEVLGDYAFITSNGITSYNAVAQYKNEGRNNPISVSVDNLFTNGITRLQQSITASIQFDNYGLFAVNTIYGYGILVFDALIGKFVALDIYPDVGAIKQFCSIRVNGINRLFFITATGFYEAFIGNTATCIFYPRDCGTLDPEVEHKIERLQIVFDSIYESGTLTATEYNDRKEGLTQSFAFNANCSRQSTPIEFPFGDISSNQVDAQPAKFARAKRCSNIGLKLSWNFDSDLSMITLIDNIYEEYTSRQHKGRTYGN